MTTNISMDERHPFQNNDQQTVLDVIEHENLPYNKRPGEFESSRLHFSAHRNLGHWVDFKMEETTVSRKGHVQTRTLSITLDKEQARQLAAFVSEV